MKPTRSLPSAYRHRGTLDLARQPLLVAALSIGAVLLFGLAAGLLLWALPQLRPDLSEFSFTVSGIGDLLRFVLLGLGLMAVVVVLHEAIHGLMFWRFTGDRPRFGFTGLYAYAAAPGWYLPRNQHLVVALAPLLLITLGGLLLIALIPTAAVLPLVLAIALNAGGAVGDLVAAVWLLRADSSALVQDTGDSMSVFAAEEPVPGWEAR